MAGDEIVGYKPFVATLDKWQMTVPIIRTDDGRVYFAIRALCRGLGVSVQAQLEALQADEYYAAALHPFKIPTDGGMQETMCIRKRECAWWLAHISPKRVKADVRGRLEEFQADLMAAADRLAFGDLSDVLAGTSRALQPLPHGAFYFPCQRCGAPHRFIVRNGQAYIEIDT